MVKPVRYCLECKVKKLVWYQKFFCSQACCIKARKRRGWFFGVENFDGSVNSQSASRSFISNGKGCGVVPKGWE